MTVQEFPYHEGFSGDSRRKSCCSYGGLVATTIILTVLTLGLVVGAFLFPQYVEHKLDDGIKENNILTATDQAENSKSYRWWADNFSEGAAGQYYKFFVFNVTNPHQIIAGEKPNLEEFGPFVYKHRTIREDVQFEVVDGQHQATFKEWTLFTFDRERTPEHLEEDMKFTTLNVPLHAYYQISKRLGASGPGWIMNLIYSDFVYTPVAKLFTKLSVKEIAFGYDDPVMAAAKATIKQLLNITVESQWPGLVGNETEHEALKKHGTITMLTGEDNIANAGQWIRWEGKSMIECPHKIDTENVTDPAWGTPEANRVRGTDATRFRWPLKKGDLIDAFVPVLSRAVDLLNHDGETVTVKDIELLRFRLQQHTIKNATEVPANAAFYQFGPAGFFNISRCTPANLPVYISQPHFREVGPEASTLVTGLTPDDAKHLTVVDVESHTGVTMNAHRRLQINLKTGPLPINDKTTWFDKLAQDLYFPVLWIEDGNTIPDDLAQQFRDKVLFALKISNMAHIGGLIGAGVFGLLAIFAGYKAKQRRAAMAALEHASTSTLQEPFI